MREASRPPTTLPLTAAVLLTRGQRPIQLAMDDASGEAGAGPQRDHDQPCTERELDQGQRAKTNRLLAGTSNSLEWLQPCMGIGLASMPPPLPATAGLTQFS